MHIHIYIHMRIHIYIQKYQYHLAWRCQNTTYIHTYIKTHHTHTHTYIKTHACIHCHNKTHTYIHTYIKTHTCIHCHNENTYLHTEKHIRTLNITFMQPFYINIHNFTWMYCQSHNNWGPRNGFQRFIVPVYQWKTAEKPGTDPQLSWEWQ